MGYSYYIHRQEQRAHNMNSIKTWADSRETSIEIAEAIFWIAANEDEAERIWDDPTGSEIRRVVIYVRETYPESEPADLQWGVDNMADIIFERIFKPNMTISEIQLFPSTDPHTGDRTFCANIVIDHIFVLQLGIDGEFSIPGVWECCWMSGDEFKHAQSLAASWTNGAERIVEALGIPNDYQQLVSMGGRVYRY